MNSKRRKSTRAGGFDYGLPGSYFITICTANHQCYLGTVNAGMMNENRSGRIVRQVWKGLPDRFPTVEVGAFVVMPNHIHGIIVLLDWQSTGPGSMNRTPTMVECDRSRTQDQYGPVMLGEVVRTLKGASTRAIRTSAETDFAWQRNFYDHIIRNDQDLERARVYIANNPGAWYEDNLYRKHDGKVAR